MTEADATGVPKPPTALLLATLAAVYMAMSIILPSMPAIAAAFDASAGEVQLTLTLYLATFAVAQLVVGPVSDRYGRRPVMLVGVVLFAAASIACATAPTLEMLMVARGLQGAGACVGLVVARAMIRDAYDEANTGRILAYAAMAMGTAPAIAPIIGGYLQIWFGWRSVFWFTAAYAVGCLALTWLTLAETRVAVAPEMGTMRMLVRNYRSLLTSRRYFAYTVAGGASTVGFLAYVSAAPLVFMGLFGMHPSTFGLVILLFPVSFIIGSFITARITIRFGIARLLLLGSALVFAATALLAALPLAGFVSAFAVLVCVPLIGLPHGLVSATGLAGAVSARPEIAGTAAALAGFLHIGCSAGVSLLMGMLTYESQFPMALVMLVIAAVGLLAAWMVKTSG